MRRRCIFVVLVVPCVFWEKERGDWSTDLQLQCALGQATGTGRACAACPGMVPAACPLWVLFAGFPGAAGVAVQYTLLPVLPWLLAETKACAA